MRSKARLQLAGVALVLGVVAVVVLAFAQFAGDFERTTSITVSAPRAGLVMDKDAKVKLRGVQIGRVTSVTQDDHTAKLTLALQPDKLRLLPADVKVDIQSTTVFGAKYVNFVVPPHSSARHLTAGAQLSATAVTVEYNTLFQHLTDLLGKVRPEKINATLNAIATALHGRGREFGDLLSQTDAYLTTMNPLLPTLQRDFAATADVTNLYADTGPDLLRTIDNATTTSDTIVAEKARLNAVLLGAIGLNDSVGGVLRHNQRALGTALDVLRPTTALLDTYNPVLNCLIVGLDKVQPLDEAIFGGNQPGVALNTGFTYSAQPYKYPNDLPKVNATGGPNCWGLPDPPQGPGAPHAPFVVTDTAQVPYAPSTRLDVNGPTIFQYLFNGVYPVAAPAPKGPGMAPVPKGPAAGPAPKGGGR